MEWLFPSYLLFIFYVIRIGSGIFTNGYQMPALDGVSELFMGNKYKKLSSHSEMPRRINTEEQIKRAVTCVLDWSFGGAGFDSFSSVVDWRCHRPVRDSPPPRLLWRPTRPTTPRPTMGCWSAPVLGSDVGRWAHKGREEWCKEWGKRAWTMPCNRTWSNSLPPMARTMAPGRLARSHSLSGRWLDCRPNGTKENVRKAKRGQKNSWVMSSF